MQTPKSIRTREVGNLEDISSFDSSAISSRVTLPGLENLPLPKQAHTITGQRATRILKNVAHTYGDGTDVNTSLLRNADGTSFNALAPGYRIHRTHLRPQTGAAYGPYSGGRIQGHSASSLTFLSPDQSSI